MELTIQDMTPQPTTNMTTPTTAGVVVATRHDHHDFSDESVLEQWMQRAINGLQCVQSFFKKRRAFLRMNKSARYIWKQSEDKLKTLQQTVYDLEQKNVETRKHIELDRQKHVQLQIKKELSRQLQSTRKDKPTDKARKARKALKKCTAHTAHKGLFSKKVQPLHKKTHGKPPREKVHTIPPVVDEVEVPTSGCKCGDCKTKS
jgi:hypothetical protein